MAELSEINYINFPEVEDKDKKAFLYTMNVLFFDLEKYKKTEEDDTKIKDKDMTYVRPILVDDIIKINDYFSSIMSDLRMTCSVSLRDAFYLKNNQRRLCVSLTINEQTFIPKEKDLDSYTQISSGICSSNTYIPLFDLSSFSSLPEEEQFANQSNYNKDGTSNASSLDSGLVKISLGLVDMNMLKNAKLLYNTVFESGITVGSMVKFLLRSMEIKKGYIMDIPDNKNTNSEIILPPSNLINAFNFIQNIIGIYEYGLTLFYDDGVFYILNRFKTEHDVEKDETSIIHMWVESKQSNINNKVFYSLNDSKESQYIGRIEAVEIDSQVAAGELQGDAFAFSSFKQGIDALTFKDGNLDTSKSKPLTMVLKRNYDTHLHSGEKVILDYDDLNNVFNMASYFNESECSAQQMNILINNAAKLSDFKPNKLVEMHFNDNMKNQRFGGIYTIKSVTFAFTRLNLKENTFLATCSVIITRKVPTNA